MVAGQPESSSDADEDPDPTAQLTYPGIHLFFYEKSSVLYYWQNDGFSEMWTSD